jgi:hypothetical protein
MKLRDMLLCIDCDEMFTIEGSRCNPRCPICASSVLMPLSAFVQTWTAFEKGGTNRLMRGNASTNGPRLEIIHPTPIAA